jgi:hypothetical protein
LRPKLQVPEYSGFCHERVGEIMTDLDLHNRWPDRGSIRTPPEYKQEVVPLASTSSIILVYFTELSIFQSTRFKSIDVLVKALYYKPEGRGIASRLGGFFSNLPNPSGRTMALGSTQSLTEMSTRNLKKETWG